MAGDESRTRAPGCLQTTDGAMTALECAPEPGLERRQQGAKQSLLSSKRSHSSGQLSDDSESRTEQSHHDQRQRRRGGLTVAGFSFPSQTWLPAKSVALLRVMNNVLVLQATLGARRNTATFLPDLKSLERCPQRLILVFNHIAFARKMPHCAPMR